MLIGVNLSSNTRIYRRFRSPNPLKKGAQDSSSPFFKGSVYAIFDQKKVLQFVGYSRDVYLSLKQHLVRQPQQCYWLRFKLLNALVAQF